MQHLTGARTYFRSARAGLGTLGLLLSLASCTPKLNGGGLTVINTTNGGGLAVVPALKVLSVGNQFQFTAAGGTPPYSFALLTGRGSINASDGTYQAPPDLLVPTDPFELVQFRLTDGAGATVDGEIQLVEELVAAPVTLSLSQGQVTLLGATGGVPPYTFAIGSGQGTLNSTSGQFTAPLTSGTTIVEINDSASNQAFVFITTAAPFGGSTTTVELMVGTTHFIGPSGGTTPYFFDIVSAPPYGSITTPSGSSSAYVAPGTVPTPSTVSVRIQDSSLPTANEDFIDFEIQPAIQISPPIKYLGYGGTHNFTVSGGVGPTYTFSIQSGGTFGSITAGGLFTAGGTTGTSIIRVIDTKGNLATAVVNVTPPMALSPPSLDIVTNGSAVTFSTTGGDPSGTPPYTYSNTGVGSVHPTTGAYTPGPTPGTAVIRSTDVTSTFTVANVRVYTPLTFTPNRTLAIGNSFAITPTTGLAPYTFTVLPGTATGSFGGSASTTGTTATFTAGGTPGNLQIQITDDANPSPQTTLINVTVNPALQIAPVTSQVAVNNQRAFSATDGVGGYTWSVVGGGCGSINAAGLYTAPATTTTCTVRVSDSHTPPNTSDATITILPALSLTPPAPAALDLQGQTVLTATGGSGSYSYSLSNVTMGTLTPLTANTVRFTAGNTPGSVQVRVDDTIGTTPQGISNISINMPAAIRDDTGSGAYTLAQTDSQTVLIGGGVPQYDPVQDYTFAFSPACAIGTLTGDVTAATGKNVTFTATGGTGVCNLTVSDGVQSPLVLTFTVNPDVEITPAGSTISVANTRTFSAVAGTGVSPFTYSKTAGPGSINGTTGVFTPAGTGTSTIQITDARGHTDSTTITVNAALGHTKSPSLGSYNVLDLAQDTILITPTGGVPPYDISFAQTGGHSAIPTGVTANTTVYLQPADGTATVTITDAISNVLNIPITMTVPAPASAPVVSLGTVTATTIDVSWGSVFMSNDNGTLPVSGYRYRINGGGWTTVSNAINNYSFTGLTGNTAYTIDVVAYSSGGNSALGTVSTTTLPPAPSGLSITSITATGMTLNWGAVAGSTSYETNVNGGGWTDRGLVTSYAFTGLTADTAYTMGVRAKNGGTTGASASASAPTLPATTVGLFLSGITTTSITLNWAAGTTVTSYETSPNGSTWTDRGNVTSYTFTGLTAGTAYTLYVRGKNSSGVGASNNLAAPTLPAAPSGLSITSITATGMTLNWGATTGATSYETSSDGSTWTDRGNVLSYAFTGLSSGTAYTLYVRAKNSSGVGVAASSASTTVPGTPGGLSITGITATAMTLNWGAVAGSTSYETSPNGSTWTDRGNVTSYTFTGLTASTAYTLYVRAKNASGAGTGASTSSSTLPGAPTGLNITAVTAAGMTLNWTLVAGATSYETSPDNSTWTDRGNVSAFAFTGLSSGTSYTLYVRAVTGGGPGASANATATTIPAAPSGLSITSISSTGMTLNWAATTGATSYETNLNGGGWTNRGNVTAYAYTGLSAGTNYTLGVRAVNASGTGSGSSASADTVPAAPSGLSIGTITGSSIVLNWGTVASATSYDTSTDGSTWTNRGAVLSHNFTGLAGGTAHTLYVRAVNGSGAGAGSSLGATTLAGAPTGLFINSIATTSMTLNWTAVGGATSYDVSTDGVAWSPLGNVTNYNFGSLAAGTFYSLYVRAVNGGGPGAGSSASAYTLPATPGSLSITGRTASSLTLNWGATAGAASYETSTDGSTWTNRGAVTSYAFGSLSAGTNYTLYVRAVNAGSAAGSSANSAAFTLPAAPGGLSITSITASSMTLNWGAVTSATSYETSTDGSTWTNRGAVTSYNFTSLSAGTNYTLYVRAVNGSGAGSGSSASSITRPPVPSYFAPDVIGQSNIEVIWGPATGATGYEVSLDGVSWVNGGGSFLYNFAPLTASTTYTMYLRAVNSSGASSALTISETTLAAAVTCTQTWNSEAGYDLGSGLPSGIIGSVWTQGQEVIDGGMTTNLGCSSLPNAQVRICNASGFFSAPYCIQ